MLVILAMLAASLFAVLGSGTTTANAQDGPRLVTTTNSYTAAWLIRDDGAGETKQWISSDCRQQLQGAGNSTAVVGWAAFGSLPATSSPLTCGAIGSLLGGGGPGPGGDVELVTSSPSYPHGWVLVDNGGSTTKQWLNSSCRQQLQAAGGTFNITSYNNFGSFPAASPPLTCDAIEALLGGGGPGPSDNFSVVNGRVIDPDGNEFIAVGMNAAAGYFFGAGQRAPIIEDRDILLNEWNLNALRLNVYCTDACAGSLQAFLNDGGSAPQFWDLGNADGFVTLLQDGSRVRQYIPANCRADLEASGYTFNPGSWNANVSPYPVASPSIACAENLPVDDIVQAYAGTKTVIVIEFHNDFYPRLPNAAQAQEALDYFVDLAAKYKDNPYVWLQPYNEPLNECNLPRHGAGYLDENGNPLTEQGTASRSWVDMHVPIIQAIRATGNKNVISPVATNFGQDRCDASGDFDRRESSLLNYADDMLAADSAKNLVFDLHFYSRWARSSVADAENYFNELQAAGIATIVGETGGQCDNGPLSALHKDDLTATALLLENFQTYTYPPAGVFHWTAGGGFNLTTAANGDASRMTSENIPFNAVTGINQLSQTGQLFFEHSRQDPTIFGPIPGCP